MNIITLFNIMPYALINISLSKLALVNLNSFVALFFNNYLKLQKNYTNNYVSDFLKLYFMLSIKAESLMIYMVISIYRFTNMRLFI